MLPKEDYISFENTKSKALELKALEWFLSYLLGRSQRILFDGVKSASTCPSLFQKVAVWFRLF